MFGIGRVAILIIVRKIRPGPREDGSSRCSVSNRLSKRSGFSQPTESFMVISAQSSPDNSNRLPVLSREAFRIWQQETCAYITA
jgi:hypothetical protein